MEEQVLAVQKLKQDLRKDLELEYDKVQLAIEKEVRTQNQRLVSMVNDVALVQLKALDEHLKNLAEQVTTVNLA